MSINLRQTSLTTKCFPVLFSSFFVIPHCLSITGVFTPYHGAKSNYLRWLQPVPCRRTADGTSLLCLDVSLAIFFWLQTMPALSQLKDILFLQ